MEDIGCVSASVGTDFSFMEGSDEPDSDVESID